MAKTATDVEVKKTTTTNNTARKNSTPAVEERSQWWNLLWIAAPIAALAATGTAVLVLRRWLSNDDNDGRLV